MNTISIDKPSSQCSHLLCRITYVILMCQTHINPVITRNIFVRHMHL